VSDEPDLTKVDEAALWAELLRRTGERQQTGERSPFPDVKVFLNLRGEVS
jgi:hypothetical protein